MFVFILCFTLHLAISNSKISSKSPACKTAACNKSNIIKQIKMQFYLLTCTAHLYGKHTSFKRQSYNGVNPTHSSSVSVAERDKAPV